MIELISSLTSRLARIYYRGLQISIVSNKGDECTAVGITVHRADEDGDFTIDVTKLFDDYVELPATGECLAYIFKKIDA